MHHIARNFAGKGWRVGFLSAPVGLPHLLGIGADAGERAASWRQGGTLDAESGVWHFVPFAPLPWGVSPILARRPYVAAAWAMAAPGVRRALRRAGLHRPDFACSDHFLHEGLLRAAEPRISVFRRADNAAGFPGALADFPEREAGFARRVDLTIVTNKRSAKELAERGVTETLLIENGLSLDRFRERQTRPLAYGSDDRPVVVFVGAADARLDRGLLLRSVLARPQYLWAFVGPFDGGFANDLRAAGAILPGAVPHDQVAGYLQHARVGIVPFSQQSAGKLVRQVSSLKIFEYAACGLPVIAMHGPVFPQDLPTPLAVCENEEQFIDHIDRFVAQPPSPAPDITAFERYDWPQRLRPLFDWLDQRRAG
jgi:glycosyltransferase involved in cell wall biosynthesis